MIIKQLAFCFLMLMFSGISSYGTCYYIDAKNGNDSNSGKSANNAWASLQQVNRQIFYPGDSLLFKAGTVYFGQLEPKGSGSKDQPIKIDMYGKGPKPAIHGQGEKHYTILLYNAAYWEVRSLEITNKGSESAAKRYGVFILAEDFGDCHSIALNGLEIHDVNGSLVKKDGGGSAIMWENKGKVKTRFVDLRIENCHLYRCERDGIRSRGYISRNEWYPSIGVIIRNNLLEQIPGDGIVPIGCDGAVVEYNVMRDCTDMLPHEEAAAGIWPWSSDNTIIQFNEVSGHKAKWDGQGFDSDYNCHGTVIQYNYSHDNWGGFLLVCNNGYSFGTEINAGTKNTIIRYNISINDGIRPYPTKREGWFSPIVHITGPVEHTKIYNNIFIAPENENPAAAGVIVEMENWGGSWPTDTWLANNVFYVMGKSAFSLKETTGTTLFTNNNFFGKISNPPVDGNAVFANPGFINADARGDGFEILKSFMLGKNSPLIGKGYPVSAGRINDFFGKPVKKRKINIGIHQF